MATGRARFAVGLLICAAAAALAQERVDQYTYQYGTPVPTSIEDLLSNPSQYDRRAVRISGTLDLSTNARIYVMKDTFGRTITVLPMPEVEANWNEEARYFVGKEVGITGAFFSPERVQLWKYVGPPPEPKKGVNLKSDGITLEQLVSTPGKFDGKNVRIVGMFRGMNLFGDLPPKSVRDQDDWVVKDDVYSVWVTGKKPKGSGWELDTRLRRDTNKWIEIVGKPETVGNVTYVHALHISLTSAPRAAAEVAPPTPPPPKPKVPPVVVFSLPLDGERDIPATGLFKVQFSKDMEEESFKGRVVFRYAGPRLPGDREFVGVRFAYEGGRRALVVDPGDVLRPGRVVEIRLLPGIVDTDGMELSPRAGKDSTAQTTDVLRFQVVASSALLPPS